LVFFTEMIKPPATPLPDLSKLPEEIVREMLTYLRTPSAECIACQVFLSSGIHKTLFRQRVPVDGIIWKNLNGWLIFRRLWTTQRDRIYKKDYYLKAREYAGHVSHKLWKEARERVSRYRFNCKNRMTPTDHKAWLRQQLAMNNICPLRASRKTLWRLFMALD
jgi:hypothetical protein